MKVLLHGCNGRMGQVLIRLISEASDMEIVCGVDSFPEKFKNDFPVYSTLEEVTEAVDILIDFSNHSCINSIIKFGRLRVLPLIICTTGFTPEERSLMIDASKLIPIFNSANMSIGVNILVSLVKQAARALSEGFDIEIIEKHHNQKLDAPSGTALMIADAINSTFDDEYNYVYGRHSKTQKRLKKEIGIHAIRGGSIVGEHQVIFAGGGEVIEVTHSAISRDVFGYGAIAAVRFMMNRKSGMYNMDDVLKKGNG
jgi:4-hydroxy-tetrahydrodipicolinate reductase